jgi:hypothetical protein
VAGRTDPDLEVPDIQPDLTAGRRCR